MSVIVSKNDDKTCRLLCKGAIENLLENCNRVFCKGHIKNLDSTIKGNVMQSVEKFQERGLRCLAFAYKDVAKVSSLELKGENPIENFLKIETDMVFVGVVGMLDPPRP